MAAVASDNRLQRLSPEADARILIVEDDDDDVRLIRRLLRQAPISLEIQSVGDGSKALDYLESIGCAEDPRMPDLILLDINMPVMDGPRFLALLRSHPEFRALPVVALTTSSDVDTVRRAYDSGANAVINKVDSLDGMSQIVNTIVDFWFRIARRYYVE